MMNSDAELTQKLSNAIAQLVKQVFGRQAELESLTPIRMDRRYSYMFRYRVRMTDGGEHLLLAKIPHQDWVKSMQEAMASEQVRSEIKREFEIMQSIFTVIQNSRRTALFAINPVGGYLSEFNAIVMEEVALRMLKERLTHWQIVLKLSSAWAGFERELGLAGEWLQVIHAAFRQAEYSSLETLGMLQQVEFEIAELTKITQVNLETLRSSFLQLYEGVKTEPIPISSLHHDFHLGNIFFTPEGQVGALDPNWVEAGPVYEDLASLLIDPVTRKHQVLSQGLLFRSTQRVRYELAVLKGYFGDQLFPWSLIYFYCAWKTLEKWRMNEETLSSGLGRRSRWLASGVALLMRLYFRRLVQMYLRLGVSSAASVSSKT